MQSHGLREPEEHITWQIHFLTAPGKLTATVNRNGACTSCDARPDHTTGHFRPWCPIAVMAAYSSVASVLQGVPTTEESGQLQSPGFSCSGVNSLTQA